MITAIWVRPETNETLIEYDHDDLFEVHPGSPSSDGVRDPVLDYLDGLGPDLWIQVFPATGVRNSVSGNVGGRVIQAGNISGGLNIHR